MRMGKAKKKPDDNEKDTSSYRIFSRLSCNFAFPSDIERPFPANNKSLTDSMAKIENKLDIDTEKVEDGDDILEVVGDKSYKERIENVLITLKQQSNDIFSIDKLEQYSPKFLKLIQNILNPENKGLHLIYSQFRTLEGVGIIKLILEEQGFAQLKVKKNRTDGWDLDISDEDMNKPKFALYTGTEEEDERELLRNIYNNSWENVPSSIIAKLRKTNTSGDKFSNNLGNVLKILMITAAGSEGINLRNTRFVHIIEPHWNYVRIEQVIGRARRICSHHDLPDELRTVKVFLYIMKSQTASLVDNGQTTDQYLYLLAVNKNTFNKDVIKAIKETSIDCAIYPSNATEQLKCINFGNVMGDKFTFVPDINNDTEDTMTELNTERITWRGKKMTMNDKIYIYREIENNKIEIYDYESYQNALVNSNVVPKLLKIIDKPTN
jgi:hypothetical protein